MVLLSLRPVVASVIVPSVFSPILHRVRHHVAIVPTRVFWNTVLGFDSPHLPVRAHWHGERLAEMANVVLGTVSRVANPLNC